ncbi:hypothetical protein Sjap_006291 [Stephania japonica]|uniref:Pre-mRNA-splicing factor Syf1/CRNKL1-like C-terminal HAT-repeats domain-containing protein n=1 Tax=Stephania japonica TaxID=461633 RepID=A0AAP0K739_9MAGN
MKNGEIARARDCYERAVEKLADDEEVEQLFVAFAEFEEKCKETERARFIYKYALHHIPNARVEDMYKKYFAFEKQYGDREGIEDAIVGKRRFQYEEELRLVCILLDLKLFLIFENHQVSSCSMEQSSLRIPAIYFILSRLKTITAMYDIPACKSHVSAKGT